MQHLDCVFVYHCVWALLWDIASSILKSCLCGIKTIKDPVVGTESRYGIMESTVLILKLELLLSLLR